MDRKAVVHVESLISDALAQGAAVLTGGESHNVVMPVTVIDHVSSTMRLFREESFGPLVVIIRAKDEAEATRLANDRFWRQSRH